MIIFWEAICYSLLFLEFCKKDVLLHHVVRSLSLRFGQTDSPIRKLGDGVFQERFDGLRVTGKPSGVQSNRLHCLLYPAFSPGPVVGGKVRLYFCRLFLGGKVFRHGLGL